MPDSDSSALSSSVTPLTEILDKLVNSNRNLTIATLTAAIVNARGKPTSISEILEISKDIRFAMFPNPNYGAYKEWAETKDQKLDRVYD